jgi:GTPase
MNDTALPISRAVLVGIQLPGFDDITFQNSLAELGRLAKTLGLEVVGQVTQKRGVLDGPTGIGTGKIPDIKALINADKERPTLVLIDHELSPSQTRALEEETQAEVMDRTQVILEIFHRHARSREAKAQVEIVRLMYSAPRMREKSKIGDRVRGGVGGKGAGESSVELDKRKIRDRIAELKREIAQTEEERKTQRSRRKDLRRVALVGYTNAGKSTLMRALTGSEVYIADKLFATLDTTVRSLIPEAHPRVLISDTVGFINRLPHDLVASFRSTLDEVLEASLVAHVVDASDLAMEQQLQTTIEVLSEIEASDIPRLLVLNKMDMVDPEREQMLLEKYPTALRLSAKDPNDVSRLRQALIDGLSVNDIEAVLLIPYDKQQLRGQIFTSCQVLEETYVDEGANLRVKTSPEELQRLQSLLAEVVVE